MSLQLGYIKQNDLRKRTVSISKTVRFFTEKDHRGEGVAKAEDLRLSIGDRRELPV